MTSLPQPSRDVDCLVNKLDTLSISSEHDRLPSRNRATSFRDPSGTPRPTNTLKSTPLVIHRPVMVDDVFATGPASASNNYAPSYRLPSMEGMLQNLSSSTSLSSSSSHLSRPVAIRRSRTQSCPTFPTSIGTSAIPRSISNNAVTTNRSISSKSSSPSSSSLSTPQKLGILKSSDYAKTWSSEAQASPSILRTRLRQTRVVPSTSPTTSSPHCGNKNNPATIPRRSVSSSPLKRPSVPCKGWAKSKKDWCNLQCRPPPLSDVHPDEGEVNAYCPHHKKEQLKDSTFKAKGETIEFSAWIPPYLDTGTQIALREAMKMAPSSFDTWGYVYAYKLQGPNGPDPDKIRIKIGSSTDVIKRLAEWRKQCYSVVQVPLGHWPAGLDAEGCHSEAAKLMDPGRKGPFCRRVERLVHLELADLVVNGQYHHPDFTSEKTDGKFTSPTQWRMPTRRGVFPRQECLDCRKVHREIFTLNRIERGTNKDSEWDLMVRPIIAKWGAFVEAHVERPPNVWNLIRENYFHLVVLSTFLIVSCILCIG